MARNQRKQATTRKCSKQEQANGASSCSTKYKNKHNKKTSGKPYGEWSKVDKSMNNQS
jgi:hypothetical protein